MTLMSSLKCFFYLQEVVVAMALVVDIFAGVVDVLAGKRQPSPLQMTSLPKLILLEPPPLTMQVTNTYFVENEMHKILYVILIFILKYCLQSL